MNVTDSLLIPLSDGGRLSGLSDDALGARYRFWRDQDGVRHVFSVYPAQDAPAYADALAIAVRRTPAGSIAVWAGVPGAAAAEAARRNLAEEIHIHVLGEGAPETLSSLTRPRVGTRDILALPAPRERDPEPPRELVAMGHPLGRFAA
ncbi:hypothetical protein GCM10007301_40230 [Azorhizobium oxalatiphilum]|uniref:Uncharacterized protein n=1 Tax=Azorhizobium oxalatiphilum TaxID=980631 RepID=A0A917C8E1_9HYPH|nr:hypothetical protein [Azorhizobium oxalatiphilum]GGF76235.1 hypothetical protein GCM10007301_40230 [Azorhizobium oxalatiphilum]